MLNDDTPHAIYALEATINLKRGAKKLTGRNSNHLNIAIIYFDAVKRNIG